MDLVERLLRQNPWWESGRVENIAGFEHRYLYRDIEKYLGEKQILSIVGLRRVGKTTLMLQILDSLLKKGVEPKRLMFFSFDEILAKNPEIIEDVVLAYEESILKERMGNVYIFLDEINQVPDWQVILKRFYELDRRIKFIVSGSSSVLLRKAKESLAGRIYDFHLKPLGFKEYLRLKGIEVKDMDLQSLELRRQLNSFLLNGSFPEIMEENDFSKIRTYASSVVEKIIFHDIPKVYDVGQPEILKEIMSIISLNPGMDLRYDSIASALAVTYQTVSKYVSYLEKAFLVKQLHNYSGSRLASARKLKKAYPSCTTLSAAFCGSGEEFYGLAPRLAELLVVNHLDANSFWRRRHEVDVVHNKVPFEVKYGEAADIGKGDIKGVIDFMEKFKAGKGVIITKNLSKRKTMDGKEIDMVPAWRFLLG
ncbi:MAG: ATP-binding protein [Candidatus Aenigmarchaeota archaeon]|nr:ATP-binding protein [Candidatus Aenigmarchaeota archaeon]